MANIFLDIEKGVEVAAEDILGWVSKGEQELKLAPTVIAAVGSVLGSVATAVNSAETAASNGFVNIALDEAVFTNVKAVWPQIVAAAATVGLKL